LFTIAVLLRWSAQFFVNSLFGFFLVLKNYLRTHPIYKGNFRGECKKSASLMLSRYILKSLKRRDAHISDIYGIYLSNDVIYFLLSFELISREVFKVVKMMCFLEM